MESKAAAYVRWRLKGLGSREAAREAGFEDGTPGGHALTLFEAAKRAQGEELPELESRADELREDLLAIREQLREVRRLLQGYRLASDIECVYAA